VKVVNRRETLRLPPPPLKKDLCNLFQTRATTISWVSPWAWSNYGYWNKSWKSCVWHLVSICFNHLLELGEGKTRSTQNNMEENDRKQKASCWWQSRATVSALTGNRSGRKLRAKSKPYVLMTWREIGIHIGRSSHSSERWYANEQRINLLRCKPEYIFAAT